MSKIEIRKYKEKDALELAAIYYNTIQRVNIGLRGRTPKNAQPKIYTA